MIVGSADLRFAAVGAFTPAAALCDEAEGSGNLINFYALRRLRPSPPPGFYRFAATGSSPLLLRSLL